MDLISGLSGFMRQRCCDFLFRAWLHACLGGSREHSWVSCRCCDGQSLQHADGGAGENVFAKIKGMISDMIAKLEKEAEGCSETSLLFSRQTFNIPRVSKNLIFDWQVWLCVFVGQRSPSLAVLDCSEQFQLRGSWKSLWGSFVLSRCQNHKF